LKDTGAIVFGPVPSRRLGRSLGINNIPPKSCSYSCVYCQVGRTADTTITRKSFYKPGEIFKQVKRKFDAAVSRNDEVDYLTFVPDGEPTLDVNLGRELAILRQIGIPRAVITNASLIWREDVKEDLLEADLVSFKIDTVNEKLWKRINRPHKELKLNRILEGIAEFAEEFKGTLVSETMLLDRIRYDLEFKNIAEFLKGLKKLEKAYIAIPTRPPAEKWVKPVQEVTMNAAFQAFAEKLGVNKIEYLTGYEGNAFACTGVVKEDLLSITAVHPMRRQAVKALLRKANADWAIIENLLDEGKLIELEYQGNVYYMRPYDEAAKKIR
jgi:wyosine [tRNA(Phe)-imidazoG37] synthetase (radical SAM superfamily)